MAMHCVMACCDICSKNTYIMRCVRQDTMQCHCISYVLF